MSLCAFIQYADDVKCYFSLNRDSSVDMIKNKIRAHKCQHICAPTRRGVEDTKLEAKAKDTKKIRGQGQRQPFRGQTLSRPRTEMLEAKAKDTAVSVFQKKKVFKKVFQAISNS